MRPSLEEVKEYFKDALEVECIAENENVNITKDILREIHYDNCGNREFWIGISSYENTYVCLWDDTYGYAKITKYKPTSSENHYGNRPDVIDFNNKYDLNFNLGSAVKYLARAGKKQGETKQSDLKKALDFITRELEVVDPETVTAEAELEVGRWYVTHNGRGLLMWNDGDMTSGFFDDGYSEDNYCFSAKYAVRPATNNEVKAALIKEAQRRYKVGDEIICLLGETSRSRGYNIGNQYDFTIGDNKLWVDDCGKYRNYSYCIFNNGKWARHA
jgi:hypothetical protein